MVEIKKTVKISEETHEKLDSLKKETGTKTLDETIDSLLSGYKDNDKKPVGISFETSHQFNLGNYEQVKSTCFTNFRIENMENLSNKINLIALIHQKISNMKAFYALSEHHKIKQDIAEKNNNLITTEIVNYLAEIDKLTAKFLKLEEESNTKS